LAQIFANRAFLPQGWRENVRVSLHNGKVSAIDIADTAKPGDTRVDALLPALPNLHSHTFQRAMAGMTERRGETADSFWTWRDLMYRFLQHLQPDDIEAIAAFAFMEMQESGFGAVAEFHYLHHAPGGARYDAIDELSQRIMAAAQTTGIGLTHLPVLYSHAGLGNKPLAENQLRFGNDLEQFERLQHAATQSLKALPEDAWIGVAPHSLRAVSPEQLHAIAQNAAHDPIHMHIAEQTREVADVEAAYGKRPVRWLLDSMDIGERWCLVHATHMDLSELSDLAKSGAVAGLCPITEANLGDGIFEGPTFLHAGGRFGIGSDSNILLSAAEELRTLEYSQRLSQRQRNVMITSPGSTGEALFTASLKGGAQALARDCGTIAIGQWADLVAIDSTFGTMIPSPSAQLMDNWIFASSRNGVADLWSAGRHCVKDGKHVARPSIEQSYRKTMTRLMSLL
jgi:formimidoylglutamate deiminase